VPVSEFVNNITTAFYAQSPTISSPICIILPPYHTTQPSIPHPNFDAPSLDDSDPAIAFNIAFTLDDTDPLLPALTLENESSDNL